MKKPSTIINALGGTCEVARILGVLPSAVSNWKLRGSIPAKYARTLIKAADKKGLDMKYEDLIK